MKELKLARLNVLIEKIKHQKLSTLAERNYRKIQDEVRLAIDKHLVETELKNN